MEIIDKKKLSEVMKTTVWIELHVDDFEVVREFYRSIWFDIMFDSPGNYLVLKKWFVILNFWWDGWRYDNQPYFRQFPNSNKKWYDVEIIIPVEDVKQYYEFIKNKCKIVEELKTRRWWAIDFRIEDPNWFYIRFTNPHDWVFEFEWYTSDVD